MKTLDRNVRGLGKKPFAAFALLGLLGFGLDMAMNAENYADKKLTYVIESPFLANTAQAAEGAPEQTENSSQNTEAKVRLLFKSNESTPLHPRYWAKELGRLQLSE